MEDIKKIKFFSIILLLIYLISCYYWGINQFNIYLIKKKLLTLYKNRYNYTLQLLFIILFCIYIFYFDVYGIEDINIKNEIKSYCKKAIFAFIIAVLAFMECTIPVFWFIFFLGIITHGNI